ncbi:putative Ig domain-containing protein [Streptomyces sp. NPDC050659]|uniref:putative Ig domain-containing protein n=1 Tax=Streptomyces sp. NPDC050659 TaxID=3157215 RepID=UPI003425C39B
MHIHQRGNRLGRPSMSTWSRFRNLKGPRFALVAAVLVGSAVVAAQPTPAAGAAGAAAASCTSLSACYDNVGISLDSNPAMADFDRHGNSFSDEALTAAGAARGATVDSAGMRFTFPDVPVGASDNTVAQGQTIDLSGAADKLGFLMSGSNGSATGTGTVTYTDGSAQSYTITTPDWLSTTPPSDGAVAVSTAHRNGPEGAYPVNIFSQTVALTPGKTLASVTLPPGGPLEPSTPALHIFAISTLTTGNTVTVTHPGNQTSAAGTPVNLQIQASDSDPGQTLTYSADGLPTGLSINSGTGLITGRPTSTGTSTVTVTATDTTGSTGSATFSWTVNPICQITYTDRHRDNRIVALRTYSAEIDIKNIGNTPINGWTLRFSFRGDQRIVSKWVIGGNYSQSGKDATITNYSFQPTIDAGATAPRITLVLGYYTNSFTPPNSFTLNGTTCVDNIP